MDPWKAGESSTSVHQNGRSVRPDEPGSPHIASELRIRKKSLHRRSATTDDAHYHPLHTPTYGSLRDSCVTRPMLRRKISGDPDGSDEGDSEYASSIRSRRSRSQNGRTESTSVGDTPVIVHQVLRTDSLAGISLKYGISLADLRRVNRLWASDPIHLRSVLYIPVHLASKGIDALLFTTRTKEDSANDSTVSDDVPVVQRIPASELAFFRSPNPADSPPPSKTRPMAHSSRINTSRSDSPNFRPLSMSLSSQGLKSLFHSFPLLSNDVPSSRTSFDASEGSSTSNASEASSDQEHEMAVLKSPKRERTPTQRSPRKLSTISHYPPYRSSVLDIFRDFINGGPELDDVSPSVVQTEQLKPSRRMEFPKPTKKA
ncbi:hypothetical protein SCHPADRAFT_1000490 [Schizopora paradoxa]|uniref:LysM domain-containing protein n=1 Tax=Schizopora paradoxa TaxID=27342 RepID=A0A0H2RWD1_9AGAM|nr:hypothetical protein SCHPADRAFT_1000490 [Schizopora paradoxa]